MVVADSSPSPSGAATAEVTARCLERARAVLIDFNVARGLVGFVS